MKQLGQTWSWSEWVVLSTGCDGQVLGVTVFGLFSPHFTCCSVPANQLRGHNGVTVTSTWLSRVTSGKFTTPRLSRTMVEDHRARCADYKSSFHGQPQMTFRKQICWFHPIINSIRVLTEVECRLLFGSNMGQHHHSFHTHRRASMLRRLSGQGGGSSQGDLQNLLQGWGAALHSGNSEEQSQGPPPPL